MSSRGRVAVGLGAGVLEARGGDGVAEPLEAEALAPGEAAEDAVPAVADGPAAGDDAVPLHAPVVARLAASVSSQPVRRTRRSLGAPPS